MKQEFYLPSLDGEHRLHCIRWVPEGQPRAVLQLVHGMAEHIGRYDEFGSFLASQGIEVVGHSHLGHGLTAKNEDELGWLSRNPENVKAYAEDPFCGFRFTLNGYYYMFLGLHRAIRAESGGGMPKAYPILFTAGAEDPVGNCGKGVRALYSRYRKFGANATIKLYPGDRHEILQESDRQQIFEDILQWMMQNQ